MDHETVIGDIESCISHGRKAVDSKGEYMGLVLHGEDAKFCHNNQELGGVTETAKFCHNNQELGGVTEAAKIFHNNQKLGGVTLQHQRLDTSTCLLVICYFDALPSHGGETRSEGLTKSSCGIETW